VKIDYCETSKRWRGYSEDYLKEARNLFIKIVIQLITLSTFVLGFGAVWIETRNIEILALSDKVIFVAGSLFEILSIILGAWALFEINKFLNKSGGDYQEKSIKLAKYIIDTNKDGGDEYPEYLWENIKERYSFFPWQVLAQILTFIAGIILLLIFISLSVF